jgi:hypothetical protein
MDKIVLVKYFSLFLINFIIIKLKGKRKFFPKKSSFPRILLATRPLTNTRNSLLTFRFPVCQLSLMDIARIFETSEYQRNIMLSSRNLNKQTMFSTANFPYVTNGTTWKVPWNPEYVQTKRKFFIIWKLFFHYKYIYRFDILIEMLDNCGIASIQLHHV